MKKKITAAALALCLVLGLLPMSVLAAQYKGTLNGEEVTIEVDDTTGAVTLPEDLAAHYTASPDKLTVGSFPRTQEFALHYNGAPTGLTINGTLVEEPAAKTFTVSFAAGDHATGTKAAETLTVPEGASSVEYTLPKATGFTPETGYTFAGWTVDADTTVKAAGAKITVSASVTLTAQWEAESEKVVTVEPTVDAQGNATVDASKVEVTEKTETVAVDLSSRESANMTIPADLVSKVTASDANVKTVEVQTSLATAAVPVEVLPESGDAKIAVTPATITDQAIPADTNDTVKTAVAAATATTVSVTDKDGKNLFAKKDSYTGVEPIEITIKGLATGKTYVVLCLSDGVLTRFGRFEKIGGSTINFKSHHLTDFIPVAETAENAAALAAVAADPGNADGTVTPPETTVKVESVKTDIAVFAKVKVSGMDENKVYLIVVGSIAKGSPQSNSVIDGADTHEFYCNTQGGKQTIGVYEFASKDAIQSGDIAANLKLRADVAKVTE